MVVISVQSGVVVKVFLHVNEAIVIGGEVLAYASGVSSFVAGDGVVV